MYTKTALVLGLLPELLAARSINVNRRGVDCSYSSAPSSGDDCDSFASSWGISENDLKNLNPGIQCPNLDVSREYCVIGEVTSDPDPTTTTKNPGPTTTTSKSSEPTDDGHSPTQSGIAKNCDKYHKIVSGDQCDAIEKTYEISKKQFSEWNPAINDDCTNLLLDYYVCVHIPGAETNPGDDGHSPHQDGIAEDCDKFYQIASGDQCDSIEKKFSISNAQFSKWNPAINDACSNLLLGYYVCVHVPGADTNPGDDGHSPHQDGIAENCDKYYKVSSGDSCDVIQKKNSISNAQFRKWNPAINSACSNLLLDYYVCVHVPGAQPPDDSHNPHQDGIAENCDKYHKVVSGDNCDKIESQNNISHDQFRKWNPAINSSCSNILLGYYVCVHVPGAQPPNNGPQPQLPNTNKNCKKYHKVASGQGCYDIDQKYNISFDQFRRWNPSVNSQCSNLQAGYYVCVGA